MHVGASSPLGLRRPSLLTSFGLLGAVPLALLAIALGFRPFKAATVALVANTAPVAFGALAVPLTTLAAVTGLPQQDLASMVGRQTPLLGVFVPIALAFIIDGARGVRQTLLSYQRFNRAP